MHSWRVLLLLLPRFSFLSGRAAIQRLAGADILLSRRKSLCLTAWSRRIALAVVQELSQMFRAVENSGADAKEPDASGFTGSKKGDASDA